MFVRELLKITSGDTPIPIFINNGTVIFLLQSYVRGYHVYMKLENATISAMLQL